MKGQQNFDTYLIESQNNPTRNVIRDTIFNVEDTSSHGENCGLISLESLDVIGDNIGIRNVFNLPTGRLSGEDLALITSTKQIALLIVQVVYSNDMSIDHNGFVLVSGYSLSLYVPKDDVCGFAVLLNEHGHFSPVTRKDGKIVLPKDIIDTISSINGSDYEIMKDTVFTDFHTPAMRLNSKLRSLFNL